MIRMMRSTLGIPRNPYFLIKPVKVRASEISKKIQFARFAFDIVEVVVFLFVCFFFSLPVVTDPARWVITILSSFSCKIRLISSNTCDRATCAQNELWLCVDCFNFVLNSGS